MNTRLTKSKLFALTTLCLAAQLAPLEASETNWTSELVAPVANPLFFESPTISSEARALFLYHNLNDKFITGGGDVQVYALQLRFKLTERLALIATKDGYINIHTPGGDSDGWADLGAGLKYALINDEANQFILTPGIKFEPPSGEADVFQGNGDGEFDLFVSAAKGIDKLQLMGSVGVRVPLDADEETSQLHYSVQLAYPVSKWFKPFICLNGYTVLSDGKGPALGAEGYDVINFGTSNASGETQVVAGTGARASLCKSIDFGFSYERGLDHSAGIFDDRFTVDLVWKF